MEAVALFEKDKLKIPDGLDHYIPLTDRSGLDAGDTIGKVAIIPHGEDELAITMDPIHVKYIGIGPIPKALFTLDGKQVRVASWCFQRSLEVDSCPEED